MTEQQGTPDQLPADKGQGGAGATYKVPLSTRGIVLYLLCQWNQHLKCSSWTESISGFGPHHPTLHLSLSCSWPYLNLRTFVEKRWSCLANVKMCWRTQKESDQSLWSRDRKWLSVTLGSQSWLLVWLRIHACIYMSCTSRFCQMGGVWAPRFCRWAVCAWERRISSLEHLDQQPE